MSSNSTPNRPNRGILVPGIDTHSAVDQKYQQPQQGRAFSPWPPTPQSAQSAQDSRRPSLAFSGYSDASYSGPSSVSSFSQPPTPMHSMVNSAENFHHQWHDTAEMHVAVPDPMETTCTLSHALPMYSASLQPHGLPSLAQNMSLHIPTTSTARNNAWPSTTVASFHASVQSGLEKTLYQSTQDLGQQHAATASMYANPSASMPAPLQQSVFPDYGGHQLPQVIVPSQLGPQNHTEHFHGYDQDEDMTHEIAQSFESNSSDAWEAVEPQSPMEDYLSPTDDGFDLIKQEFAASPFRSSLYRSRKSLPAFTQSRLQASSAKKPRKARHGQVFGHSFNAGIEIEYAGPHWTMAPDEHGRLHIHTSSTKPIKPHKCLFEKDDGAVCGASFDRSEHLKRHAKSHTNIREYPCPLPKCTKEVGRSDNMVQHLRTHLKLPRKGARNDHHDLVQICKCIHAHPAYADDKKGIKLIANLQKGEGGGAHQHMRDVNRRRTLG
ncbi:Putative Zinc finger C2H2-type [Septoria linicola]|uniref:Zinc finger C2H2-type n=1 Tax=Septoria linicola TaxID=215465 RepID=A0A9Q9EHV4_9PEZI|nr:putative Zinc finger C2H2-type [Septoria linicola]USW50414.1 Putative Zinc finger C2H2-type [Septoria linicola]